MSSNRASPVVGQGARAHAHSRRDRQVARGPADAAPAICEGEPWRHCGKLGRSTERPMSTPRCAGPLRERPAAQGRIKGQGAVGRSSTRSKPFSSMRQDIARKRRNLALSAMRSRCSALDTLRRPRRSARKLSDLSPQQIPHWHGRSHAQHVLDRLWQRAGSASARQGSRSARPAPPACGLDRLRTNRQSSPKRSWLGPTEPVLQRDKVCRLALGALIPTAFLFEAPAGVLSLPAPRRCQNQCASKHMRSRPARVAVAPFSIAVQAAHKVGDPARAARWATRRTSSI